MIEEFDQLINDFDLLPKVILEPTFLEICKYPYNRFEEICSRLLCFYFSPLKEHGLGDLFLRSLMEILKISDEIEYKNEEIRVISEDNAEGKRLDILIYSKKFVIGIENKITANLYNPLEIYKNRIELYSKNNVHYVVLSLREINNKEEKELMTKNGFTNITYNKLFGIIDPKIITHEHDLNNKYILYLRDFIKTLNNMTGTNILNKELSDFFVKNSNSIENLVSLYNDFQGQILKQQKQKINNIKVTIESETLCNWWLWEGWLLGTQKYDKNNVKLGLEAYYNACDGDALGVFYFQIVTWSLNDWNIYEKKLIQSFPGNEVEKTPGKCSLSLEKISGDDEKLILEKLKKYYLHIDELVKETQKD